MPKADATVAWLRQAQDKSGGFKGLASARPDNFEDHIVHPTIFFTALILSCLKHVPGTSVLRVKARQNLLAHRSQTWTWNYWERDSSFYQSRPYPDDLDDTACALAGLLNQTGALPGVAQGHLARALISTEQQPGGPYNTWLIDTTAYPVWHDIDIAVNANLGYMLSLQNVHLAPLEAYLTEQIGGGNLISTYYIGEAPVIYFIARWYRGLAARKLEQRASRLLRAALKSTNALEVALLATACQHLRADDKLIEQALRYLKTLRVGDHWAAHALYYEPPIKDTPYYAGSEALTTAFCLEALNLSQLAAPSKQHPHLAHKSSAIIEPALSQQPELKEQYQSYLRQLIANDPDKQITAIADITVKACGGSLQPRMQALLNSASTHGWMAYTLFDDILDDSTETAKLPLATTAFRHMLNCFYTALPKESAFKAHVDSVLSIIDNANYWEQQHCRLADITRPVNLAMLPDYGSLEQLAARSWGHTLAPTAVLIANGKALSHPLQEAQHRFYHHYIIARQLIDDAHDWELDLQGGQLTAVNVLLLKDYFGPKQPDCLLADAKTMAKLRLLFWQKTIIKVSKLASSHLHHAKHALADCKFEDPSAHQQWLKKLDDATRSALHERKQTYEFLRVLT